MTDVAAVFSRNFETILTTLKNISFISALRLKTFLCLRKELAKPENQTTNFLTVYFYHVTYPFQSESTLYSCLNVKELLARSRREI